MLVYRFDCNPSLRLSSGCFHFYFKTLGIFRTQNNCSKEGISQVDHSNRLSDCLNLSLYFHFKKFFSKIFEFLKYFEKSTIKEAHTTLTFWIKNIAKSWRSAKECPHIIAIEMGIYRSTFTIATT